MKKILSLIISATLILSVCGCAKKNEEKKTPTGGTGTASSGAGNEVVTPSDISADGSNDETALHTDNYSESEVTEKVTVVVDGNEITPTDNNGNPVETIIHDGVVYLPVKTVADSAGLAYYWDGPNYTVYLGDTDGTLEYPTVEIENMTSVNQSVASTERLIDNYGNRYSKVITNHEDHCELEYLLNMKYSKFKGTLYIPEGVTSGATCYLQIVADGKTIYTSPEMTRTSAPVEVDVDVTGYNDVKINFSNHSNDFWGGIEVCLANAGFYQ